MNDELSFKHIRESSREPPERGFTEEEYALRTEALQHLMRKWSLGSFLFMTEPEIRYFSGFDTRFWESPTRPWFLVVPAKGKPIAVIPKIGEPLMRQTWLDDIRTWQSPNPVDEGIELLVDLFNEPGLASGDVGMATGSETSLRMSLNDYNRLLQLLPETRFEDATPILRELRNVKSEAEVRKIAYACHIASQAFHALRDGMKAGDTLRDVHRRFKTDLLVRGADDVLYLACVAGQGGYSNVIAPPTDHKLQKGDVVMLDTGTTYDGYFCDFDRNYSIGKPTAETKKAYDALLKAGRAGFKAAQPGNRFADVFEAMSKSLRKSGYDAGTIGRLGHGLGMQLTEPPSVAAWDDTSLFAGTVLTLEPCLTLADGMEMVHEENIVVGSHGPVLLTDPAPEEMPAVE